MPKGIRKACANCIKARLACDEGRPCQRCVVHACECVAVPRKPRVKKQKIDTDPPAPLDKLNIPSIDLNCDVVVPNWGQGEFAQGAFGAFQLDRSIQASEESQFDGFAPNTLLSPVSSSQSLSPMFLDTSSSFQLTPPLMTSQIPSPPQLFSPPSPVATGWSAQNIPQLQAALIQQLIPQSSPLPQPQQTQPQLQPQQTPQPLLQTIHAVQQPIQPVHIPQPSQNVSQLSSLSTPLVQQQFPQQDKSQSYDSSQMLSLLMEEKPMLNEWQGTQFGNYAADAAQQTQSTNFYDPTLFKKQLTSQISPLPQAMNAIPLFPAPIAVFDKMRFQLLDANTAMAEFIGLANVAEMATKVTCMDDLIDSEAAQIAKQAYVNFVTNPSPCFRLGEVRTHNGTANKTVEFHVDLTEQLLILTIKNVFDSSSRGLPDMQYPSQLSMKSDMSTQQCKAFEFLSPID